MLALCPRYVNDWPIKLILILNKQTIFFAGKLQERLRAILREERVHRRPSRRWSPVSGSGPGSPGFQGRRSLSILSRQKGNVPLGRGWTVRQLNNDIWTTTIEQRTLKQVMQQGSEYRTTLVFEWSKSSRMPNGLIQMPFEYRRARPFEYRRARPLEYHLVFLCTRWVFKSLG